jgi:hypothetical protein
MVGLPVEAWPENRHRSRLFRVLSLGGYVAFDLPRAVTGLGVFLLASDNPFGRRRSLTVVSPPLVGKSYPDPRSSQLFAWLGRLAAASVG